MRDKKQPHSRNGRTRKNTYVPFSYLYDHPEKITGKPKKIIKMR